MKTGVLARAAQQGTCWVDLVWCAAELAADAELAYAPPEVAQHAQQAWQRRRSRGCPAPLGGCATQSLA